MIIARRTLIFCIFWLLSIRINDFTFPHGMKHVKKEKSIFLNLFGHALEARCVMKTDRTGEITLYMTTLWKILEVKHNGKPSKSFRGMVNKVWCDSIPRKVPFSGQETGGIKDGTYGHPHYMSPVYFLRSCKCLINSCWPKANDLGLSQGHLR